MHHDFAAEAMRRDADDPLRAFRDRFYLPEGGIYLDGNSLGLLSRDTEASVLHLLAQWRTQAIGGWNDADPQPWFTLAETLGAQLAPLAGAGVDEVIPTGSTTLNLHQLLATLFDPARVDGRTQILADELNFPSDLFAIESHLRLRVLDPGVHLVKVRSRDGWTLHEADILDALAGPNVQMAILPSVLYTSGQLLPMARITQAARERGVCVGWDLSHSVGALPHTLSDDGADFAFWCHYKYLNSGPGAVGGLYLNRRHFGTLPGLAGWFGSRKDRQFDLTHTFSPSENAGALQIGTPHLLSLAPLAGALGLHHEAGIERLREKSLALTDFLRRVCETVLARFEIGFATPRANDERGGHLALIHPQASLICRALRQVGVVPDFRPPNVVRLAPVPLYTSFADCWEAAQRLARILETGTHTAQGRERGLVP